MIDALKPPTAESFSPPPEKGRLGQIGDALKTGAEVAGAVGAEVVRKTGLEAAWKKLDGFGKRCVANHRVDSLGKKIDGDQQTSLGIDAQIREMGGQAPGAAALRERQLNLRLTIDANAQKRADNAKVLHTYYKGQLDAPDKRTKESPNDAYARMKGGMEAADKRKKSFESARDEARDEYKLCDKAFQEFLHDPNLKDTAEMGKLVNRLKDLEAKIQETDGIIESMGNVMHSTDVEMTKWQLKHGDATRRVSGYEAITKNGRTGTSAVEQAVGTREASRKLAPVIEKARATHRGKERVAAISGAENISGDQRTYDQIAKLILEMQWDLKEILSTMMDNLQSKELKKPLDASFLVAAWNAVPSNKDWKLDPYKKPFKNKEMDIIEFGQELDNLGMPRSDIIAGMSQAASELDKSLIKRKKAA